MDALIEKAEMAHEKLNIYMNTYNSDNYVISHSQEKEDSYSIWSIHDTF